MMGALVFVAACTDDNGAVFAPDSGGRDATGNAPSATDGGGLKPFTPPDVGRLGAGELLLTASGEQLALSGYSFPAQNAGDPVFADGWQISFAHLLVTFDRVTLSSNPDKIPTDQSQTDGVLAEVDGPWAVDLHKDDPSYVNGKETGERAVPFAVLSNQNKNGNAPFATDGTKYAIGFDSVNATLDAMNVNLGPEAVVLYREMAENQCTVLYAGTATFKGGSSCTGGVDAGAANIPATVRFKLCFKSPTSYVNCGNPDNAGAGSYGEPHPRGIAFPTNTFVTGEVTYHTDHPFWESVQHDTPPHFDQMASQAVAVDAGAPVVTMDRLVGLDYTGFKDATGAPVPWRICDPAYQNPNGGSRTGQMHFDPVSVPRATDPAIGFRDYYDYSTYNQSTQGHWNGADGLCFVKRHYPSPP